MVHQAYRHAEELQQTKRHRSGRDERRTLRRQRVHLYEQGEEQDKAASLGAWRDGDILQAPRGGHLREPGPRERGRGLRNYTMA